MNLSKEQISFIENYLIKNEVKFWDVRLELLDHIASSVEDKMSRQGLSFEMALLEVHRGFGNQIIKGSVNEQTEEWTKGLFQANNGFKKFTRHKQKEIGRKYRYQFWKTLPGFLVSGRFLLEFSLVVLTVFCIYQFSPKAAVIVSVAACYGLEFLKVIFAITKTSRRKSLRVQMGVSMSMLFFSFGYFTLIGIGHYYPEGTYRPYDILTMVFLLLYPCSRHGLRAFMRVSRHMDRQYQLIHS